uniref:Nuclear receptor domain-containing protein n=1 Tax=Tetranychus urticae TaxID=32264 RepID=T1KNF2_TETUR
MPTMTNKGPEMVMKNFKTEEDDRCRSLVCDPSGIIVAEMVYRCMICFYITDTMVEAKQHYTSKHMDDDDDKGIDRNRESFLESEDMNNSGGLNYIHNHNHILNHNNHSNGNNNIININRQHHLNSLVPQLNGPYYKNYSGDEGLSPDDGDNYDPYSPLVTMTEGLETTNGETSPNGVGGKSGYVNCAVCGVTRFYSCVQRRYGQLTCVTCYRYFRTFMVKPKKYSCPTLGECLLNVRTRCRACWIKACIDVFSVDSRRANLIEDYLPCRAKPGSKGNTLQGSQALTAEALADLNLGSASTGPSPEGSAGSSSGEIPTLSIAYNTNGDGSLDLSKSLLNKNGTGRAKNEKPAAKVKITPGKKVWSCGKCATCMAEDCGKCIYCLDRPKFGGPFIKKQRCIKRRCLNKVKNKAANGNSA